MSLKEREILDGLQQLGCLPHLVLDLRGQRGLGGVAADRSLIPEGDQGCKTEPASKRKLHRCQAFAPGSGKRPTAGLQIMMIRHVASSSHLRHTCWMGTWGTRAGRSVTACLFQASMPHDVRYKPLSQALWRVWPDLLRR